MKIITQRCDICNLELYYENTKEGKQISYHKAISLTSSKESRTFVGEVCSSRCAEIAIANIELGTPVDSDRLNALAETLGYTITRKQTQS